VPPRLSAVDRIRAQIDELFASQQDLGQVLEQVARLSVRLVIQAALEAEVTEFLGRDRYARGERDRAGYRNGHAELTVKTTAGPVVLERPKLRGTEERSPPGCWARASRALTRWRPWSSPGLCVACRPVTWRPP
jgi:putative transposase